MHERCSDFGPEPRLPSDMLRSILLAVKVKITSYTKWAHNLKENHLLAILFGFTVGDIPGIGTFYDFQARLWNSDSKNLSISIHPTKEKPKKSAVEGGKALPVEKITVKDIFEQFQSSPPKDMNACWYLFQIFNQLFFQHSNELGLIDRM